MTTPTTNYSWGKPVNGASADTWGTELNTLIDAIDTQVKANDTSAKNASSLSSGTVPDARLSGNLSSIAALTSAADRVPYYTGASTAQLATFTSFARSLVANADASSTCGTLGLGSGADVTHGSISVSGVSKAASFNSSQGATSAIAPGASAVLGGAGSTGMCIVNATIPGAGAAAYTAYAIIISDRISPRIATQVDGALLTITLSGSNIVVTQNSGSTVAVAFSITYFGA